MRVGYRARHVLKTKPFEPINLSSKSPSTGPESNSSKRDRKGEVKNQVCPQFHMLHALTSHTDRLSCVRWVLESCAFNPRRLTYTTHSCAREHCIYFYCMLFTGGVSVKTYFKAAGGGELSQKCKRLSRHKNVKVRKMFMPSHDKNGQTAMLYGLGLYFKIKKV